MIGPPRDTRALAQETDANLMEWAKVGNRSAFGLLFRRHGEGIWKLCYLLLHDGHAADDALQETFLRGLKAVRTFRGESEPRTWLCSIALNASRRLLRQAAGDATAADTEHLDQGRPLEPHLRGVLTSIIRRERSRDLAVALGYLTQPQREAVVLHYVEGLPWDRVAHIMQTTPGAARALAHRGRRTMYEKMGREMLGPVKS